MHALVVLPTYNEAANIEDVLRRIRASLPDAEVLVVDDDSPDGTSDLAATIGAEVGGVHVLTREGRPGFGEAYRAGFAWGLERGAQVLVQMDADLSHDPAALPQLLAGLAEHDLVIGSRYIPGGSVPHWGLHRRLLSLAGNRYAAIMLGLPLHDVTSGYRVWAAAMLRTIDLRSVRAEGYGFQIEMTLRAVRAGARVREVPITFVDRRLGESKMSGTIVGEALLQVTRWGLARAWDRVRHRRRRHGTGTIGMDQAPSRAAR